MGYKKHNYKGFSIHVTRFSNLDVNTRKVTEHWGMVFPNKAMKRKRYLKIFGYYCLWIGRWVGIKKYVRDVPARTDIVIDFLFWKFIKEIRPKKWTTNQITIHR